MKSQQVKLTTDNIQQQQKEKEKRYTSRKAEKS